MTYNGSDPLSGSSADANIRNAISAYCASGHSCVLHCYSAGCLRMLKAVSDLRAQGNTLPGLQWAQASGSAAGGSRLAEISTRGLTGMLAKLTGLQEKIDWDITPSAARNRWGYVQDDMGKTVYHVAGNRDTCKSLLGAVRICGNTFLANGAGDGLVNFDSAAGYSSAGAFTDACGSGKYPFRAYDTNISACGGVARDHLGIHEVGSQSIANAAAGTYTNRSLDWNDPNLPSAACSNTWGDCDNQFVSTAQRLCRLPNGTAIAGCVDASGSIATGPTFTSAGTCAAHCGGPARRTNGTTCWCDPRCAANGDCCSDYASSNCAAVLSAVRQPVHRGWNAGRNANYYSHSLDDVAKNASIHTMNAFYVYGNAIISGVTSAVYQCVFSNGQMLITPRADCFDPQRNAFGTNRALLGYVPPTAWDASTGSPTTQLFELFRNGDRIYTRSTTERSNLQGQGWTQTAIYHVWAD
jgi:hypothetical protein